MRHKSKINIEPLQINTKGGTNIYFSGMTIEVDGETSSQDLKEAGRNLNRLIKNIRRLLPIFLKMFLKGSKQNARLEMKMTKLEKS